MRVGPLRQFLAMFRRAANIGSRPRAWTAATSAKSRRAAMARLTLWAMCLNIIASMIVPGASANGVERAKLDAALNVVVACTSDGYKRVALNPGEKIPPSDIAQGGFCPFCLPIIKHVADVPRIPSLAIIGAIHLKPIRPPVSNFKPVLSLSSPPRLRAPPIHVS
ncbi:DUF2946 family protein [Varunaivibrio sulfuroxidans]|uniref:DUF2946 family protein n=1 Tax=Varunaivibrio sulfuroxidans TaxID=1773489 RepID=UPI00105174B6|nr:DUF2946 family protein [Varunaivibrio sulfuroxidans]WES29943.1 hypothetical protein P3M64_09870 [Varunaivibrio sulfuroxidans]